MFSGGERVKVLFGLRNIGNDVVNVMYLVGLLNVLNNFNFYVMNFMVSLFGDVVIKLKKEVMFEYEFVIDS